MFRRYLLYGLLPVLLAVLLCGCEDGLLIIGMEVVHYPDNIVYIAGKDTQLDLTGGVILLITKNPGSSEEEPFSKAEVMENVDFSTPGVYPVTVKWGEFQSVFTVQVITPDDINERIG